MKTRVQKLGDGLAVVIPDDMAVRTGLVENAEVDVTLENGALVARPVAKRRHTLEELLRDVTDDQLHPETVTGPAVGKEAW
jgi:antitoxin MazE